MRTTLVLISAIFALAFAAASGERPFSHPSASYGRNNPNVVRISEALTKQHEASVAARIEASGGLILDSLASLFSDFVPRSWLPETTISVPGRLTLGQDFGPVDESIEYLPERDKQVLPMWISPVRIGMHPGIDVAVYLRAPESDKGETSVELLAGLLDRFAGRLSHMERDEAGLPSWYTVHALVIEGLETPGGEVVTSEADLAVIRAVHEDLYADDAVYYHVQRTAQRPIHDVREYRGTYDDAAVKPIEWHQKTGAGTFGLNMVAASAAAGTDGAGQLIHIPDDAFDISHAQLSANFKADLSRNLEVTATDADAKNVAGVWDTEMSMAHGTACAGMAVAAAGECARGNAPGADWSATKRAFVNQPPYSYEDYHVISLTQPGAAVVTASYGPTYNTTAAKAFVSPNYIGTKGFAQMQSAATGGDTVFSYACGNDPFGLAQWETHQNSPYSIGVAASDATGKPTNYVTAGSGLLVSAPAGDSYQLIQQNGDDFATKDIDTNPTAAVHTTDVTVNGQGGYITDGACTPFSGTSASSPQVAGLIALMQSAASRKLSYKEVQLILATTARFQDSFDERKQFDYVNPHPRGYFSYRGGWGVADGEAAIQAVKSLPAATTPMYELPEATFDLSADNDIPTAVGEQPWLNKKLTIDNLPDAGFSTQFTMVQFTLEHPQPEEVLITLFDPDGLECIVWGDIRDKGPGTYDLVDTPNPLTMMTRCNVHLDSKGKGEWNLYANDLGDWFGGPATGKLTGVSVFVHGYKKTGLSPLIIGGAAAILVGGAAGGGFYASRRRSRNKNNKAGGTNDVAKAEADVEKSTTPAMLNHPGVADMPSKGSKASKGSAGNSSRLSKGSTASKGSKGRRPSNGSQSRGSRTSKGSKGSKGSKTSKGSKGKVNVKRKGSKTSKGSKGSRGGAKVKRASRGSRGSTSGGAPRVARRAGSKA